MLEDMDKQQHALGRCMTKADTIGNTTRSMVLMTPARRKMQLWTNTAPFVEHMDMQPTRVNSWHN